MAVDVSNPEQVDTIATTTAAIMNRRDFARGVQEARNGLPPNYDDCEEDGYWSYERGRQFALVAPRSLPLRIGGRLNPKAIALYDAACKRGWLI